MISLKNPNLAELVQYKLDKLENKFSEDELWQITDIVFDWHTIDDDVLVDDMSDLKYLKNLCSLYLLNAVIGKNEAKNIFTIPKLREITFDKVTFLYSDFISELKISKIAFLNTNIDDFTFLAKMTDLEELEIINNRTIDARILKNLIKLKVLNIKNCIIKNIDILENLGQLEFVGLDYTNIENLSFLNDFTKLRRISVTEKQIEDNKETINKLRKRDVKVYIDDCIEY